MSGRDANDTLRSDGEDALRTALDEGEFDPAGMLDPDRDLKIGSEAEVALRVIEDLRERYGEITYSEGELWFWNRAHWEPLTETMLLPFIRKYDGQLVVPENGASSSTWKLSDRVRNGVQKLIAIELRDDDFFKDAATGINVKNGFIEISNGEAKTIPHRAEHRTRHVLQVTWNGSVCAEPPEDTLLHTLIEGCFRGDLDAPQKAHALAEVAAAALLGLGTKLVNPKAAILYGQTAGNGKSKFLGLFRQMMDERVTSTLTAQQLGDDKMRATLPGVLLNTADELGASAIRSDTFKGAITGERTAARQVYKVPITVSPMAQHIFATNTLPPFSDGMDAGVLRRLHIIPFNRTIPEEERIANLDRLIVEREPEILLNWIIAGALRLIAQDGFTQIPSAAKTLNEWMSVSDPVEAWLNDEDVVEITGSSSDFIRVKDAYTSFKRWSETVGLSPSNVPWQKAFTQRIGKLNRSDISVIHKRIGNVILGIKLTRHTSKCDGNTGLRDG